MTIFDTLSELKIDNKEFFVRLFKDIVKRVQNDELIESGEFDDHFIVIDNRLNSTFINVVPKQAYNLFLEMPKNQFSGFSVLADKDNNVRVSCFGIECSMLAKSLTNLH